MDNVALYKPMLDWWATASAATWILGLSIIFACLAYCDWLAHDEQRQLPELLRAAMRKALLLPGCCSFLEAWRLPISRRPSV